MDKEPPSAATPMDTRSNKEIPSLDGDMDGRGKESKHRSNPYRTYILILRLTESRDEGGGERKNRNNPSRSNTPIKKPKYISSKPQSTALKR